MDISNAIICDYCSNKFNNHNRLPEIIKCGHVFCSLCFRDFSLDLKCLKCDKTHDGSVTDFAILQGLKSDCDGCTEIDANLIVCNICLEPLLTCVGRPKTRSCGHTSCATCFVTQSSFGNTCPSCRKEIEWTIENPIIKKLDLNEQEVPVNTNHHTDENISSFISSHLEAMFPQLTSWLAEAQRGLSTEMELCDLQFRVSMLTEDFNYLIEQFKTIVGITSNNQQN